MDPWAGAPIKSVIRAQSGAAPGGRPAYPQGMQRLLLTALVLTAISGPGHAAPDPLRAAVFRTDAPPPAPDRSGPPRDFGMPRTALERSFGRDELTGSVGFLCGLQPKAMTDGAAAAHGVDPHGRFVGVKLRMSLR